MKKLALFVVAITLCVAALAQPQGQRAPQGGFGGRYTEKEVYSGPDVVIRQIDEHTWLGNGHLMSNESIYIIEGNDRAMLIDAGTKIEDLDKIVAQITSKPVTLYATHVHPDHTGESIKYFDEIYINAADMVNVPSMMKDYKGEIKYLSDGQVIDLGGREIEVIFAPAHTPGSTVFFDKANHYGFSGDAFGSGNLLLSSNFSTLWATCSRIAMYMQKNGIEKMYPGHYGGTNPETLERVLNMKKMSEEMLDGTREAKASGGNGMMGLNASVRDFGVNINYNYPNGIK